MRGSIKAIRHFDPLTLIPAKSLSNESQVTIFLPGRGGCRYSFYSDLATNRFPVSTATYKPLQQPFFSKTSLVNLVRRSTKTVYEIVNEVMEEDEKEEE